ncbi:hypothetical protein BST81_09065 [Leptolyngbya sp. 'hensonii']|uniref:4'-phosphopantetheinyl transferase family protein n=1 Tax=Leptolyngbya sp. 'hensonii' TaxID=1922337 RepID=UPI0009502742|nr:4'-phosphopantetheinyl transferase superfamily protein [Leptolyngbya sp. 'hensonii']OLP18723.1 hypothetical protein BST81_09065 [Leptolyngbya sp. 'hensonii']
MQSLPSSSELKHHLQTWFGSDVGIGISQISGDYPLFPEEVAYIRNAVAKRQAEFATGRWCAREALATIGVAPQPLPVSPLLAPCWPEGTIGSITHDRDICLAIALPAIRHTGVGIDLLHPDQQVGADLAPLIVNAWEQQHILTLNAHPTTLRSLFSIKESVVKAISKSVGRFMDLLEITIDLQETEFAASCNAVAGQIHGWHVQVAHTLLTAAIFDAVN